MGQTTIRSTFNVKSNTINAICQFYDPISTISIRLEINYTITKRNRLNHTNTQFIRNSVSFRSNYN
ncbi:hypothetical protein HanIR_Chr08g0344431 [Helianthus annuus]|nr:hypothetical protein HanIR_Chr08g0344431 [Helianthus annuus]